MRTIWSLTTHSPPYISNRLATLTLYCCEEIALDPIQYTGRIGDLNNAPTDTPQTNQAILGVDFKGLPSDVGEYIPHGLETSRQCDSFSLT